MSTVQSQAYTYTTDTIATDEYTAHLGDSIEVLDTIPDESIGLQVFSPPFPGMYAYSDSPRDIGNCADIDEMIEHFRFMIPKLFRVLMQGRNCCVHLTQSPVFKWMEGYIGLKDFRGKTIAAFEDAGFIYYGEACIDKCPQVKAARTKDATLQMKSFCKDSSILRPALADYMLLFKRPGENADPVRAGTHPNYPDARGWLTPEQWILWARPVWGDIRETNVLNVKAGKDPEDEKHLCPLQLDAIERCVLLWSNPGDTVLSPFMGIGSEGYVALKNNRRFTGIELKPSYFRVAVANLDAAIRERESQQIPLFALEGNATCES